MLLQCSALRHPALPGLQSREHDPAEGHSVRELCQRPEYPVEDTIYRWIQQNPDFSEKYLAAREVQADRLACRGTADSSWGLIVLTHSSRTGLADPHNRRLAVPTTVTASPAGPLPQKNVNRIFYLIRATLRGILGR